MTKTLLVNTHSHHIPLADNSVQMIATSPPYFGLRDYLQVGQIGLERTVAEYIASLMLVFNECWRVLRPDGTLWVNLGDSYAGGNGSGGVGPKSKKQVSNAGSYLGPIVRSKRTERGSGSGRWGGGDRKIEDLRPKNLIGIPWRVAFALQDAGWYLRNDIIWSKPNPMPESVLDRCVKSHEYVFMLTKSKRYYFDNEAIKEESITGDGRAPYGSQGTIGKERQNKGGSVGERAFIETRNPRTVWTIPTNPYSGAHFATWPPALVEPMILAGSSPQACEHCAAPWKRTTASIKVTNWIGQPTCKCSNNTGAGRCIVLDPFVGSGTTLMVARQLERNSIGLDLSFPYLRDCARERLAMTALEEFQYGIPVEAGEYLDLPLFAKGE